MANFGPEEHSKLNFISETFVKPFNEVTVSKQPYYLSPVDLRMLVVSPMQKGLLFNTKPNLMQSYIDQLKHALSITLVHFYPWAGQLATEKYPDASWIYVDCNKGRGARIIHANILDLKVSDILSSIDVHPIVKLFFDLGEKTLNYDGHTNPLVSVQVTELQDGMFIGFTVNHSLADGTTLWHFISTLSEIFLQFVDHDEKTCVDGPIISRKPIFEPFLSQGSVLKIPYLEPEEFVRRSDPGPLRERYFHFSSDSMAKLKAKANEQLDDPTIMISSFQALCAFLWRCVTKARQLDPNLETFCTLATNFRPRVEPQLSENHFGNFVTAARSTCTVSKLLGFDLSWASALVHKSISVLDNNEIVERMTLYAKASDIFGRPGSESKSILVGGSSRFDMYGPEFGLGRAVAVLAGYANKHDGKIVANPGRGGGGSVDMEVCLRPDIMSALESDEEFMSFVS